MVPQIITESNEETKIENTAPKKVVRTTTKVVPPEIPEEPPQKVYKTKKAIFRTYQIVWYILGIVEVLLTFRIFLKFVGANPGSGFTQAIYQLSDPFAVPFLGVVPAMVNGISIFEWSTILAMAFYAVVAWGVIELFQLIKPVDKTEVEQTVDSV